MKLTGALHGSYECIGVQAVLEDCIDQLAILGHILPSTTSYQENKSARITTDGRFDLERLGSLAEDKPKHKSREVTSATRTQSPVSLDRYLHPHKEGVRVPTPEMSRRDNIHRTIMLNTKDSIYGKVAEERDFLHGILVGLHEELQEKSSFTSLLDVVKAEKHYKKQIKDIVKKKNQSDLKVKELKEELKLTKKEGESENEKRDDYIAELKYRQQMMKVRCSLEKKYVMKVYKTDVLQSTKKHKTDVAALVGKMMDSKEKMEAETRCHSEICAYLNQEYEILKAKKSMWSDKYVQDNIDMSNKLDQLKASRAKDLDRLQEMTKLFEEYQQVCIHDRLELAKESQSDCLEKMMVKGATKIQCWWRGTMVRKSLGPFRKGKKKKGRKGKKGKGKKK